MIVSKLQFDALFSIKNTGQAQCDPALLAWLCYERLIADDLVGMVLTAKGEQAIRETYAWRDRMEKLHDKTVYGRWLRGE